MGRIEAGRVAIVCFILLFAAILGLAMFVILRQWSKDRRAPRYVVRAVIADKRTQKRWIRRKRNAAPGRRTHRMLVYSVIFAPEQGEPIELRVNKRVYAKLQKEATGILTYQGTKYLGFDTSKNTKGKI